MPPACPVEAHGLLLNELAPQFRVLMQSEAGSSEFSLLGCRFRHASQSLMNSKLHHYPHFGTALLGMLLLVG